MKMLLCKECCDVVSILCIGQYISARGDCSAASKSIGIASATHGNHAMTVAVLIGLESNGEQLGDLAIWKLRFLSVQIDLEICMEKEKVY